MLSESEFLKLRPAPSSVKLPAVMPEIDSGKINPRIPNFYVGIYSNVLTPCPLVSKDPTIGDAEQVAEATLDFNLVTNR